MAPEYPPALVIFDSRLEDSKLKGTLQYIEVPVGKQLRVRWDVKTPPKGFRSVGGGVAYVRNAPDVEVLPRSTDAVPDHLGNSRYRWSEGLQHGIPWVMFVLILPAGHTLDDPEPLPARVKEFKGRVALYWILQADEIERTSIECTLKKLEGGLSTEVERLTRLCTSRDLATTSSIKLEDEVPKRTWDRDLRNVEMNGAFAVLKAAMEKVPAVKYALGIAGLAAAIAIIRILITDWRVAVFGIIVMLFLMVLLFAFAKLTTIAGKDIRMALMTLLWFSLILTIATGSFLFTSAFFGWPVDLRVIFGGISDNGNPEGSALAVCPEPAVYSSSVDFDEEMVSVPATQFTMGNADSLNAEERDVNEVPVDAFRIDRFEVTNLQYQQFISGTGRRPPASWNSSNFPGGQAFRPVVDVTWYDARDYCQWAAKRLPTEAEWEVACRGTDGRLYPWGELWDNRKANTSASTCGEPWTVGSYSPGGDSVYGATDMIGNVYEWVSSLKRPYPYHHDDGREDLSDEGSDRVLRGGSWRLDKKWAQCTHRSSGDPESFSSDTGFRCAKSSPTP